MDRSNFDIVRCSYFKHGEKNKLISCPYWHIIITDGFKTRRQAYDEVIKIIRGKSFYNKGDPDFERNKK